MHRGGAALSACGWAQAQSFEDEALYMYQSRWTAALLVVAMLLLVHPFSFRLPIY